MIAQNVVLSRIQFACFHCNARMVFYTIDSCMKLKSISPHLSPCPSPPPSTSLTSSLLPSLLRPGITQYLAGMDFIRDVANVFERVASSCSCSCSRSCSKLIHSVSVRDAFATRSRRVHHNLQHIRHTGNMNALHKSFATWRMPFATWRMPFATSRIKSIPARYAVVWLSLGVIF